METQTKKEVILKMSGASSNTSDDESSIKKIFEKLHNKYPTPKIYYNSIVKYKQKIVKKFIPFLLQIESLFDFDSGYYLCMIKIKDRDDLVLLKCAMEEGRTKWPFKSKRNDEYNDPGINEIFDEFNKKNISFDIIQHNFIKYKKKTIKNAIPQLFEYQIAKLLNFDKGPELCTIKIKNEQDLELLKNTINKRERTTMNALGKLEKDGILSTIKNKRKADKQLQRISKQKIFKTKD